MKTVQNLWADVYAVLELCCKTTEGYTRLAEIMIRTLRDLEQGNQQFVAYEDLYRLHVEFYDQIANFSSLGERITETIEGLRVTMGIEVGSTLEKDVRENGLLGCMLKPFDIDTVIRAAFSGATLTLRRQLDAGMKDPTNVGECAAIICERLQRGTSAFYWVFLTSY